MLADFRHGRNIAGKCMFVMMIALNALFLAYWVLLAMNYCLHYDDVHFMWKMREYSIFEYVKEMYMSRGGNFIGYFENGVLFTLSNFLGDYHFWPIVYYGLGVSMTFFAFKGKVNSISNWKLFIIILTLYNIYVLTVPDYAVFTWLCAMSYFIKGPAICLFLRYINENKLKIAEYALLVVLAIYLSGSNVTLTPMVWILMLANIGYLCFKDRISLSCVIGTAIVRRMFLFFLGMLAVYIIMFVAPGNFSRLESGSDMSHPAGVFEFVVAWCKCFATFLYFMAFYLPYHLVALTSGFFIGRQTSSVVTRPWKMTTIAVLAFAIYVGIAIIPLAYLSNGFGIQRNYIHITFFYMIMWVLIGYVWGNYKAKSKCHNEIAGTCLAALICVVMVLNLSIDVPIAKAYNRAHKEREAKLLDFQQQGNKETIKVSPYPSTATVDAKYFICNKLGKTSSKQAIYYESDTSKEPNEYEFHVRKLLKLDYDFVLSLEN